MIAADGVIGIFSHYGQHCENAITAEQDEANLGSVVVPAELERERERWENT